MAASASPVTACAQTTPPSRQIFCENGSRNTAPGCQSAGAPGGRPDSTASTRIPRSCTHGAKASANRRPAAWRPKSGSTISSRRASSISFPILLDAELTSPSESIKELYGGEACGGSTVAHDGCGQVVISTRGRWKKCDQSCVALREGLCQAPNQRRRQQLPARHSRRFLALTPRG